MEEPGGLTVHGVAKSRTRLSDLTFTLTFICGLDTAIKIQRLCENQFKKNMPQLHAVYLKLKSIMTTHLRKQTDHATLTEIKLKWICQYHTKQYVISKQMTRIKKGITSNTDSQQQIIPNVYVTSQQNFKTHEAKTNQKTLKVRYSRGVLVTALLRSALLSPFYR